MTRLWPQLFGFGRPPIDVYAITAEATDVHTRSARPHPSSRIGARCPRADVLGNERPH